MIMVSLKQRKKDLEKQLKQLYKEHRERGTCDSCYETGEEDCNLYYKVDGRLEEVRELIAKLENYRKKHLKLRKKLLKPHTHHGDEVNWYRNDGRLKATKDVIGE